MTGGPETTGVADRLALRELAERYAQAVDRRQRDAFLSVFHPDGALVITDYADASVVTATLRGHGELGVVTDRIRRYDKTFHFVGTANFDIDGDRATGEVYCVAHHLTRAAHGGTDFVMLIRYHDRYSRRDGRWGVDERRLEVDWTELRAANPA